MVELGGGWQTLKRVLGLLLRLHAPPALLPGRDPVSLLLRLSGSANMTELELLRRDEGSAAEMDAPLAG